MSDTNHTTITIGEVFASEQPAVVQTVLGSCIAACLFDPVAVVGGMNHFMLPNGPADDPLPTRYGKDAMEELIGRIEKLGGRKHRLEAKIFGAASVLDMNESWICIPCANKRFIREYLASEDSAVLAERLGGKQPLKVRMTTHTGRIQVRALERRGAAAMLPAEQQHRDAAFHSRWQWFKGCSQFPSLKDAECPRQNSDLSIAIFEQWQTRSKS